MRINSLLTLFVLCTFAVACGGGGGGGGPRCRRGERCSPALPNVPGMPDTSVQTALPPVPSMVNVRAQVTGDAVEISFDPIDGARDYRVYALPSDDRISSDEDGHVTVQDGLFRCAGDRQAPRTMVEDEPYIQSHAIRTFVDGSSVQGYERSMAEATLGHVWVTPGEGRIPVYAMGDPGPGGDNRCYFARWNSTRVKRYVTDMAEREALLAARWRDDGIVFYVPALGVPVHEVTGSDYRIYFVDGPEAAMRDEGTVAFHVLAEAGEGTQPLMRVYHENGCGDDHDELVPGVARFERTRYQGDQTPEYVLHFSGITEETVLVVEALLEGCPYAGLLQPVAKAPHETNYGWDYQPWVSIESVREASDTGEVFINGQHEDVGTPRPIARSFIRVSPADTDGLDFFEGFETEDAMGTFAEIGCGLDNCWAQRRFASDRYDVHFTSVEPERFAWKSMLGELWVGYADVAADVDGKIRITPHQAATMSNDAFLYVTMEVSAFTTARRYPQIMISDQIAPVQHNMEDGNTIIVQTFRDWPPTFEVQVCDHVAWNVNAQCPSFNLHEMADPSDPDEVIGLFPNAEVGEHLGLDRATRMEVYASTERVYLYLDGEPFGCVNLPNDGVPNGAASVTYGDVLYHSGVDGLYAYSERAFRTDTQRHYDNLGFRSGVEEPEWDENRLPCVSRMFDQ